MLILSVEVLDGGVEDYLVGWVTDLFLIVG